MRKLRRLSVTFSLALAVATGGTLAVAPAARADDQTIAIHWAVFTGTTKLRAGVLTTVSTDCTAVGVIGTVPFVGTCDFYHSGTAAVRVNCTGPITLPSISTLTIHAPGMQDVDVNYDPTVATEEEGEGTGFGVGLVGHVEYAFAAPALCDGGTIDSLMAGYASVP